MKIKLSPRSGDCQYHPGRAQVHRRILSLRRERTEATKCMCQEFKDQIADSGFEGFCHCMFYYKSLQD